MKRSKHWLPASVAAVMLAGCGSSQEELAVAACKAAVSERLQGKVWSLVDSEFRSGYRTGEPGLAEIVAPVYFDKGLPAETQQRVTCRVQFDPANASAEPAVIGLIFQW
ncbi:MAG: hypothetical protein ACK59M_11470 [Pseudomonadota bacterium]|jgi:hypothetical protein